MANILVVCKRSIFIQAVQPHLFDNDIQIVCVCTSPRGTLVKYKSLLPDIVLMDANWSHATYSLSGMELIQSLINYNPAVRIIVMTTIHEPSLPTRMRERGIKGYFPKTGRNVLNEIITCIKTVHNGGEYFSNLDKEFASGFD